MALQEKIDQLKAERDALKTKVDGLKVALAGTYGKLGSVYSPLYAPDLMIAVTLTGQLALLTLIERCEQQGIRVVSANTDSITVMCSRAVESWFKDIVSGWERDTGFEVEWSRYKAIFNQSVNSYIGINENGKIKRKGPIADPWSENDLRGMMSKNPQMTILSQAVVKLARDNISIEETIMSSTDPRAFVTVQKVTGGGATWRGHNLGSVVRFYYSIDGDQILYATSGRRVPKTDGSRPLMELTDRLPDDIDYARYIKEARKLASELAIVMDGRLF